jgi:hypothetical protein
MADAADLAVPAAALGGAYLLSRARGNGDSGQRRPGRIPIPIGGGGGGGGGIDTGLAGLLASGGLGGKSGPDVGGLFSGVSGLLAGQQKQFGKLLKGQQAGLAKLLEESGPSGDWQERLGSIEAKLDSVGRAQPNRSGGSSSSGGSGSSSAAPRDSGLPPEARGANPFLEAARGLGEATSATAEFVGGPGDSPSSGSIFGGIRSAGRLTGDIPDNLASGLGLDGSSGGGSSGGGGFDPSPGNVLTAPATGGLTVAGEEIVEELR